MTRSVRPRAWLPPGLRRSRSLYRALAGLLAVVVVVSLYSSSSPSPTFEPTAGGQHSCPAGCSCSCPTKPTAFRRQAAQVAPGTTQQEAPVEPPKIVHPIPAKIQAAEAKFSQLVARQSPSLAEAAAEYKRRYGRPPPKGFDDWFAFATANGAVMIDEYDQLVDDLRPFWLLSGAEIRRRSLAVSLLPSVDLVHVQGGKALSAAPKANFIDSEDGARAECFRSILEKFEDKLPDMDFPINTLAEGRILTPWEQSHPADPTEAPYPAGSVDGKFLADWAGDGGSVWKAFLRTCAPTSQARRRYHSLRSNLRDDQAPVDWIATLGGLSRNASADFAFSDGVDDRFDFCANPGAHFDQGHFFSDWRTLDTLYPIFSPAKAPGFNDILIPSYYNYWPTERYTYGFDPDTFTIKDVDDMEVAWEKKSDRIFWRGATTGGGSTPSGFLSRYQRHRLVRMTSQHKGGYKPVVFRPPGAEHYVEAALPIDWLNDDMMDIAFTKAVGCTQYPGGCDGMRKDHRFADPVPLGEAWRHKYLIDIDGMSYSGRFISLLTSRSAVLKTTIYREWFSDWIQPWVHYIPISTSYKELYHVHAFFSGPTADMSAAVDARHPSRHYDDRELRKIADEGRKWASTIGRTVDMEIYVYRVAIEWARLVADDRDGRAYEG